MRLMAIVSAFFVSADALVVVVTHAAGRMGVSVVGQLVENWRAEEHDEPLQIRAIMRSEEEKARLSIDLCGAVVRNGELSLLRDLQADLGIKACVVPDDCDEPGGLLQAFEGADAAVLLSAAHADFSPACDEQCDTEPNFDPVDPDALVPGKVFHERASRSLAATFAAAQGAAINVRVPPVAGAAAARRLSAEIAAVSASASMKHVLLRSSMGVASLHVSTSTSKGTKDTMEAPGRGDERAAAASLAATAVTRMGGSAAIAAQADAEAALRVRCAQRGVGCTVRRLGALMDS